MSKREIMWIRNPTKVSKYVTYSRESCVNVFMTLQVWSRQTKVKENIVYRRMFKTLGIVSNISDTLSQCDRLWRKPSQKRLVPSIIRLVDDDNNVRLNLFIALATLFKLTKNLTFGKCDLHNIDILTTYINNLLTYLRI